MNDSVTPEQLAASIQGPVGKAKKFGKIKDKEETQVEKLLSGFVKGFSSALSDLKKVTKEAAKAYKSQTNKTKKKDEKEKKTSSKAEAKIEKGITKFTNRALKRGSIYVHDTHCETLLKSIDAKISNLGVGGGRGRGGRRGGTTTPGPEERPTGGNGKEPYIKHSRDTLVKGDQSIEDLDRIRMFSWEINKAIGAIQKTILGGMDPVQTLFSGIIGKEMEYARNLRAAVFETQGITGATNELQDKWADIGKTVGETGVNRTVFQEQYIKNIKRGLKEQKRAVELTKIQLNTEKMLGLEAGALGEGFTDAANKLGASNGQIAEVGRGMQRIARTTGLTGDQMTKVVSSSQQFLNNLKSAGNLSASISTNVMQLVASLEKRGVLDKSSSMMKALTSQYDFIKASSGTQAMIAQMAGAGGMSTDKLMNDPAKLMTTKKGQKTMAEGMAKWFKQTYHVEIGEIDKLTADQRSQIDTNLKYLSEGEMGLGDLQRAQSGWAEGGKSTSEMLSEIEKKMKNSVNAQQVLALKEEKRNLIQSEGLSALTALGEAAKGAKDMNEALTNFGKKKDALIDGMNVMGVAWTSNAKAAEGAINKTISALDEGLLAAGKKATGLKGKDVSKALKTTAGTEQLLELLNAKQRELSTAQKAQADPISNMEQTLSEYNESFRQYSQKTLSFLWGIAGGVVTLVAVVSTIAAQMAASSLTALTSGLNLKKAFGILTGRGTAAAAAEEGAAGLASMTGTMGAAAGGTAEAAAGSTFMASMTAAAPAIATVAAAVVIATGVFGAFYGAIQAGTHATDIFNVTADELTVSQSNSAKSAGMLTGVLNALTLGLFDCLGATGSWTVGLANFFEKMPVFKMFFGLIIAPIEVIWELLKGIGGIIGGIWDMFVGLITFDWDRIKDGFANIFVSIFDALWNSVKILAGWAIPRTLWTIVKGIGSMLYDVFITFPHWLAEQLFNAMSAVPMMILGAFKSVLVDFPKWIINTILDGLESLATNEWIGPIFDPFVEIFYALGDALAPLWDAFTEIYDALSSIVTGVTGWIGALFGFNSEIESTTGIMDVLKTVIHGVSSVIGFLLKIALYPLKLLIEGLAWVIKGVVAIGRTLVNLVLSPLETVFAGISAIVTPLVEAFKGLMNWIMGVIGSLKGYSETSAEQSATWDKEGPSAVHGVSGAVGGIGDVFKGNFAEGGSKMLSGLGEGLSALMPWNWFEEGTRKVANTGLGVLHAGEAVVPANEVKKLGGMEKQIAEGNGPFGNMADGIIEGLMNFMTNPISTMGDMMMSWLDNPMNPMNLVGLNPFAKTSATATGVTSDVSGKIMEGRATTELPTTRLASNELDMLSEANIEQLEVQKRMSEALDEIAAYLKPSASKNSGSDPDDTSTRTVGGKPPNYHKWAVGQHRNVAGKNTVNTSFV